MGQHNFQSLLPKDDVELHNYQAALNFAMEHNEIRNVALSGSYGSGKSSVINSYEKCCPEKKFLHISLADFDSEGKLPAKNTPNLLEGKILNQLLHQINPQDIKQSQFRIKADKPPHYHIMLACFCAVYALILLYAIKCTHKTGQMKLCQTREMDRLKNAEPKLWTKSCAITGRNVVL